jgi:hypothetical protein
MQTTEMQQLTLVQEKISRILKEIWRDQLHLEMEGGYERKTDPNTTEFIIHTGVERNLETEIISDF